MLVLEEVETFLAVVRAGSLRRGAETVHVTQSTVSYRVAALERRVGRRLLLRSRGGRGVALTTEGRRFLGIAENWERLSWEVQELRAQKDLRLSVGSVNVLAGYLLPPLYQRLAQDSPHLSLRLETGTGLELEERVAMGHLHVAFTVFWEEHVDLDVTRLTRSPMRLVVNLDKRGAPPSAVSLSDLSPRREVHLPWGAPYELWRREQGMSRGQILADSSFLLPPLLRNEGAWAIVPGFMVDQLTAETGCTAHALVSAPPAQDVFRIIRRGRRVAGTPEVRLLDEVLATLWPQWRDGN